MNKPQLGSVNLAVSLRVTPVVIHRDVAYLGGQLPQKEGRIGVELNLDQGRERYSVLPTVTGRNTPHSRGSNNE